MTTINSTYIFTILLLRARKLTPCTSVSEPHISILYINTTLLFSSFSYNNLIQITKIHHNLFYLSLSLKFKIQYLIINTVAFGFQMIMWLGKSTLETNLEHIFYFVYWITSRPIEEYFQAKSVSNKAKF